MSAAEDTVVELSAALEARMREISRMRREEARLVALIRSSRLLRGALEDEDDKWQQVAGLRADQAAAREEAAALRARLREVEAEAAGEAGRAAQRSLLNCKRAEEAELVAAIRGARLSGQPLPAAEEDAMWARIGRLREEQGCLRARIREASARA